MKIIDSGNANLKKFMLTYEEFLAFKGYVSLLGIPIDDAYISTLSSLALIIKINEEGFYLDINKEEYPAAIEFLKLYEN